MNDRNWTLLIDAILQKKVVLILGDNLFYIKDNPSLKIGDYILDCLNQKFSTETTLADTFTKIDENIQDYNYIRRRSGSETNIYYEINQILKETDYTCDRKLVNLVQSGYFPLILSTSFAPSIPNILGIEQSLVNIYCKTSRSDINISSLSSKTPSLYYLFGRSSTLAKTYMVTEDDLLDYMHYWHDSTTRPSEISEYLSGKYLLVLGCDYPNWLFRFFWHSMKNFSTVPEDHIGIVSVESKNDDNDLRSFLARIQANVYNDASEFIAELDDRLNQVNKECNEDKINDTVMNDIDFFISYANEDVNEADYIVQTFKECGSEKIWFDKNRLKVGNDYDRIIKESIMRAKRFVPILSKQTLHAECRYFRKEWFIAEEAKMMNYPNEYITPIIIDDCDVYSRNFPEMFSKVHCISSSSSDFKSMIKDLVRDIRK